MWLSTVGLNNLLKGILVVFSLGLFTDTAAGSCPAQLFVQTYVFLPALSSLFFSFCLLIPLFLSSFYSSLSLFLLFCGLTTPLSGGHVPTFEHMSSHLVLVSWPVSHFMSLRTEHIYSDSLCVDFMV